MASGKLLSKKHSILELHSIKLEKTNADPVTFYSYYTNESPIYYELLPIIKIFKFPDQDQAIEKIPKSWIKRVDDFDNQIFKNNNISNETLFGESSAIAYLLATSDNKSSLVAVKNLYNICIRKIESDRIKLVNTKVVKLKDQMQNMSNEMYELTKQLEQLKTSHDAHVEVQSNKTSLIKSAIDTIVENHSVIQEILKTLLHKI